MSGVKFKDAHRGYTPSYHLQRSSSQRNTPLQSAVGLFAMCCHIHYAITPPHSYQYDAIYAPIHQALQMPFGPAAGTREADEKYQAQLNSLGFGLGAWPRCVRRHLGCVAVVC